MLNLHYTRPVVGMAYTCQDHNKSGEKKKLCKASLHHKRCHTMQHQIDKHCLYPRTDIKILIINFRITLFLNLTKHLMSHKQKTGYRAVSTIYNELKCHNHKTSKISTVS